MATSTTLAALLQGVDASLRGNPQATVNGLSHDSRTIRRGDVFIAIPGHVQHGLRFLSDAVAAGAIAVVAESAPDAVASPHRPPNWVQVRDARCALAAMSCNFWHHPSTELTAIGVTGTNGKTTVTALLESILRQRGPAARWSTTAITTPGRAPSVAIRTTPEAPQLQQALREMVAAGCWAAAIEVSSHALALNRVDGTRFAVGVFTNLSADHLDFHRTMTAYRDAKARLFAMVDPDGHSVLNARDVASVALARASRARVVWYAWAPGIRGRLPDERIHDSNDTGSAPATGGQQLECLHQITSFQSNAAGLRMSLESKRTTLNLSSPLFGPANAENIAAAATTALKLGIEPALVETGVAGYDGEPGRLERIVMGQNFDVLVDYAHTPNALLAALDSARSLIHTGRLILVFGCGGDRDRQKRSTMGRIAVDGAELAVLTSDNPRREDPIAIIDDVTQGVPKKARDRLIIEPDRRSAILLALRSARRGECVLIAGKGHETRQIFADRDEPFDDREVATELLIDLGFTHVDGIERPG